MRTDADSAGQAPREAIAGEVRAEMARQQITQRDLATRLGWHPATLNRRCCGLSSFRAEELSAIADALGVSVDQFTRPRAQRAA